MICEDCRIAADAIADLGVTAVTVGMIPRRYRAPLDDTLAKALNVVLSGHERCAARRFQSTNTLRAEGNSTIQAFECTCQHRRATIPLTRH